MFDYVKPLSVPDAYDRLSVLPGPVVIAGSVIAVVIAVVTRTAAVASSVIARTVIAAPVIATGVVIVHRGGGHFIRREWTRLDG